jgi:hypothetical protein
MEITDIALKRILYLIVKKTFSLWEMIGLHVTPNHYYETIPDVSTLSNKLWQQHSKLIGIDMNEQAQINFLSECDLKYKEEFDKFSENKVTCPYQYFINNGYFEAIDGEILYCMIRHFKPTKMIEIGSGYSTYMSAQAIIKNKIDYGHETELVAIEPYPNKVINNGFPGLSHLIRKKLQDVPLSDFTSLEENDILFIDSSHVLKIGSDVQYEYLDILPRLKKGVIVHIHDIFLPEEYPRDWIFNNHIFWNEQYLLQAFMAFNENFKVLWAGNYMCLKNTDQVKSTFNSYKENETKPGSFWIMKVK